MIASAIDGLMPVAKIVAAVVADLAKVWIDVFASNLAAVIPIITSLAGVWAQMLPPLVMIVEIVLKLGGALFQVAALIINVLMVPLKPLITVLSMALEILLTPLLMAADLIGALAAMLQEVLAPILRGISDVIAAPFQILKNIVGAVMGAFKNALGTVFAAFGKLREAFRELQSVFADLFEAVKELADQFSKEVTDAIKMAMSPLIDAATWFANIVVSVATRVRQLADDLRLLLGLPKVDHSTNKQGAFDGLAVRNVGTTTASGFASKIQQSAFGLGKDANQTTAEKVTVHAIPGINEDLVV